MQLGCQEAGARQRLLTLQRSPSVAQRVGHDLGHGLPLGTGGTIDIHRRVDVDSAASDQPLATLLNLTACYGVIEADAAHAAVACGYTAAVRRWVTRGLT